MPRGRPKGTKAVSKLTQALTETLAAQTEAAQAVVVQEKLDQVTAFQAKLEGELDTHFTVLKGLRDRTIDKEEAPGAKVNLAAAQAMMEYTHRLHPERQQGQGVPVTVNILVQLLTKPAKGVEVT